MTTEKQITANRANAKRSTGPKTLAGKLKSSRNAVRHGLSGAMPLDARTLASINSIASALAGEDASQAQLISATEFAQAQLELLRVRSVRAKQTEAIESDEIDSRKLGCLASLDRYERLALTKRRRASRKL